MRSGDVLLRQSLEYLVPFNGDRPAWFGNVSQRVGLPRRRVKSLFYNPGCRIWGDEQQAINSALSRAKKSQNQKLEDALRANAQTAARQDELEQLKKELKIELLEDLRALLLELRGPAAGDSIRNSRPGVYGG